MIRIDPQNPKGIVWIASYPKSGNTWVRAFLAALHRVMAGDAQGPVDLNQMASYSASDRQAQLFEKYLDRPITEVAPGELAALRPRVQEDIARDADGIVFTKTHNARMDDHGVPMINQSVSVGALYLVRNPLDVAISFAHFRDVPIDQAIVDMGTHEFGIGTSATDIHFVSSSWSENVRSWTERRHPAVLVMRYEDLLDNPIVNFTHIARHVRMLPEQEKVERAVELSSFDKLRSAERETGFQEKPDSAQIFFREGRAGQWREVLTPAQVDRIVTAHGEQMARFGYLPDEPQRPASSVGQ
jgi:Sulfotransferase domain